MLVGAHRWYRIVRGTARHVAFRSLGGLRVIDEHKVPLEGALIVAPVHLSNADPPAVASSIPRAIYFMAKEELFKVPILGPLIRSVNSFPVHRGKADTEAMRIAIQVLNEGKALLVFPEGRRGDGKRLNPLNKGVAMLASRTGATVLPVGIVGTNHVLRPGKAFPHIHRVTVAFGDPFKCEGSGREAREAFTAELQRRLLALCAAHGGPLGEPDPSANAAPSD